MERPWKLVAPWYRWPRQMGEGVAAGPRDTRPVLQKFDRPDFVPGFVKDPQHSLRFTDDDFVYTYQLVKAEVEGGVLDKFRTSFFRPKLAPGAGPSEPKRAVATRTGIRKIFLDTHKRYYAVVCELHCDAPGFPRTTFDQVCQAGFVVRRRLMTYAKAAEPEARKLVAEIAGLQEQLVFMDELRPLHGRALRKRTAEVAKLRAEGTFEAVRSQHLAALEAARARLLEWKSEHGAAAVEEGWIPTGFDKIGRWQVVEEKPQALSEAFFPLYPLYSDERNAEHDAQGRSIWFGVLPTSALETDERGTPRFDDESTYLARCFVRRHTPQCERTFGTEADCQGELTFSEPTELYKLASQFDLVGTSNRPFTVQMPDLAELAALAKPGAAQKYAPMRVVQKQSLNAKVNGKSLEGGSMGLPQICFIALPLFVLVGYFVFQIFLPIVVFVFGLWFLLAFKLCILPSVSLEVGLQAEIDVALQAPKLDAGFDVDVQGFVVGGVNVSAGDFNRHLAGRGLSATEQARYGGGLPSYIHQREGFLGVEADIRADFDGMANTPLVELGGAYREGEKVAERAQAGQPVGLELTADLQFEPRVPKTAVSL